MYFHLQRTLIVWSSKGSQTKENFKTFHWLTKETNYNSCLRVKYENVIKNNHLIQSWIPIHFCARNIVLNTLMTNLMSFHRQRTLIVWSSRSSYCLLVHWKHQWRGIPSETSMLSSLSPLASHLHAPDSSKDPLGKEAWAC